jgi:DNA polymerase
MGQSITVPGGGESARERVLGAAYELFSTRGIQAVGVDAIVQRSGVARQTLYRQFGSKQELVLAFLALREQVWTRDWLEAEIGAIEPEVLVCLGATAAQSLLGKQFRVTKERGRWLESELAPRVTATIHPSAILRQRDDESRKSEMQAFVNDLKLVAAVL